MGTTRRSEPYTPTTEDVIDLWVVYFTHKHDSYMTGIPVETKREEKRAEILRWLTEHEASLVEGLVDEVRASDWWVHTVTEDENVSGRVRAWLREKARQRRGGRS